MCIFKIYLQPSLSALYVTRMFKPGLVAWDVVCASPCVRCELEASCAAASAQVCNQVSIPRSQISMQLERLLREVERLEEWEKGDGRAIDDGLACAGVAPVAQLPAITDAWAEGRGL